MEFDEFLKTFFEAIGKKNVAFVKNIYLDWLQTSGMVPKEQEKYFFTDAIFSELKSLLNATVTSVDVIDEYYVAHLRYPNGDGIMTFKKKGDTWVFFNEMSNKAMFTNIYTINYTTGDGQIRVLFNGKRTPVVTDMEADMQGMVSPINSALKKGENTITLQSLEKKPVEVSIQMNGTVPGGVANSRNGNVLDWKGTVNEDIVLKFNAE